MLTPDQIRRRLEHAFTATQRQDSDRDASDGVYRAVHMLIDVLGEVLPDLVAPPGPLQRPESQFRDFEGTACRRCQQEIRATTRASLEAGMRGHVCGLQRACPHCGTQVGASSQAMLDAGLRAHRCERPCPDCTPEQPCDRVRSLTGG